MFRTFLVEFLLPLLLFLLVRNMIRGFLAGSQPRRAMQRPQTPPVPLGGELKKDPVCGTYVSMATAIKETVKGEAVYFCSKECREKYRQS
jgi:YHS domain-containing protein